MAAAVADFAPGGAERRKIKKAGHDGLSLELEPTADMLAGLAARRAAPARRSSASRPSTGPDGLEQGRRKLAAKGLDAVVVNDISRSDIGFDSASNEVTILTAGTRQSAVAARHVPRASKELVAAEILDAVIALRRPARSAEAFTDATTLSGWTASTTSTGAAATCSSTATHQAAIVPLSRARDLEPDKASIREALGRALFHAQRYEGAAAEFEAVARTRRPTTTRCSASGARCSCSAATARPASRSRWPARCVPSARTTAVPRPRAARRRRA